MRNGCKYSWKIICVALFVHIVSLCISDIGVLCSVRRPAWAVACFMAMALCCVGVASAIICIEKEGSYYYCVWDKGRLSYQCGWVGVFGMAMLCALLCV